MNLSPAYLKQREERREEGEVKLLLHLLRRRFGQIAPDLEQRITSLSIPQLEALVDAQLDFCNLDDLVTWLSAQS
jgi:predicted transposase YdaD